MKINFTKREFRVLLQLVHLGDWMLHAHEVDEPADRQPFRELRRKLYLHFKEMDCEDLIEAARDDFYETRAFETLVEPFIEQYDDHTFWEELVARLGRRDAEAALGHEALESMSGEARVRALHDHETPWYDEVVEHGLDRLRLDTSGG